MKKNNPPKQKGKRLPQVNTPIGIDLNFAASEAYKLLRTNVMFSMTDEQKCRIIGVTSSQLGEGKSTTSANLAYSLAEAGKWVLLIDGDMRRPSISQKLNLPLSPGLSNLLVGLSKLDDVIQGSKLNDHLRIIAAGDIPPNPSELLGLPQMRQALNELSRDFDFIILDLPPVTVVSDPLVSSKLVDGMIVVVRQNYVDRRTLDETMRQLKYANAKVLGFVMTYAGAEGKKYKRYKKYGYGKYGKYGGYEYYGDYSTSQQRAAAKSQPAPADKTDHG